MVYTNCSTVHTQTKSRNRQYLVRGRLQARGVLTHEGWLATLGRRLAQQVGYGTLALAHGRVGIDALARLDLGLFADDDELVVDELPHEIDRHVLEE